MYRQDDISNSGNPFANFKAHTTNNPLIKQTSQNNFNQSFKPKKPIDPHSKPPVLH